MAMAGQPLPSFKDYNRVCITPLRSQHTHMRRSASPPPPCWRSTAVPLDALGVLSSDPAEAAEALEKTIILMEASKAELSAAVQAAGAEPAQKMAILIPVLQKVLGGALPEYGFPPPPQGPSSPAPPCRRAAWPRARLRGAGWWWLMRARVRECIRAARCVHTA